MHNNNYHLLETEFLSSLLTLPKISIFSWNFSPNFFSNLILVRVGKSKYFHFPEKNEYYWTSDKPGVRVLTEIALRISYGEGVINPFILDPLF